MFLGYSGLGISIWPAIIPPDVSIWTAAPPQSLGFALVGALAIIPVILMYTAWSYYVFPARCARARGITDAISIRQGRRRPSWRSRLLWLALIWAGSVALGVAAWAMRLAMRAIGMSH